MSTIETASVIEDVPAAGRPKPKAQGGGFGRYLLVRFLLIFPTIFILVTLFLPDGVVGLVRRWAKKT